MNPKSFSFPGNITLGEARELYFRESGIGREYDVAWVKLTTPWFPLFFPNSKSRVKAAKLHDLHHIATEYPTTWKGEAEIGAWEFASGCGPYFWAWSLNSAAVLIGLLLWPKTTFQAFKRGRKSTNLYHLEPGFNEKLLTETVSSLRTRLKL